MNQVVHSEASNLVETLQGIQQNIDQRLLEIEELGWLHANKQTETLQALGKLVEELDRPPFGYLMQLDCQETRTLNTRLAALFTRLLTDFTFKLHTRELFLFTAQKRAINHLFAQSGFYSTQALQTLLTQKAADKKTTSFTANSANVRKILSCNLSTLSPEDSVELSLEENETAAVLILGLLLDRMPASVQGEAIRKFLLETANPWPALPAHDLYKHLVANVWMLCSYSVAENKHAIKRHLNEWFKRVHRAHGLQVKPTGSVKHTKNTNNKPVMAIAAENFGSRHAMYRWYAPVIKALKTRYHMVLVSLQNDADDTARALFDEHLIVPADEMGLQPILNACTPDIAYFPSIGMRAWSISLANLRWAPLQIMSLGHPASSFSDMMDAVFINTRMYAGIGHFTENQLVLEGSVGNLIEAHLYMKLPPATQLPNNRICIAVPCNVMKLNQTFINTLQCIQQQANQPVQFMFFPNEFGIAHLDTSARLQQLFPGCVVAIRTSYEEYLTQLNRNHFALSPFPFGNATSCIDCLVLGLPFIAMIGIEPHSRSDYDVLSAFELEDYCVADSVEHYIQGAVNWINNPATLQAMRELIASKNFLEQHFNDTNELSGELCDALDWAWQNQALLREQHGQVYNAEGRWASKV